MHQPRLLKAADIRQSRGTNATSHRDLDRNVSVSSAAPETSRRGAQPLSQPPSQPRLEMDGAAPSRRAYLHEVRDGSPQSVRAQALIVTDSSAVRMDLRGSLHSAGFQVTACDTKAAARKAIQSRAFGLIVLDVLLPDGSGIELLTDIRSTSQSTRVPVIVLSSEGSVPERLRAPAVSADAYIPKPFDSAQVVKCALRLTGRDSTPPPSFSMGADEPTSRHGGPESPRPKLYVPILRDRTSIELQRQSESRERASPEPPRSEPGEPAPAAGPVSVRRPIQVDLSGNSLLQRALVETRVAKILDPVTIGRVCRRAGVDLSCDSSVEAQRILPEIRSMLLLFLSHGEADWYVRRLATALANHK
jgi:CheY-like chemotaxis protein